jgi:hypothetical protein
MRTKIFLATLAMIAVFFNTINAQDEKDLKLSGELLTDQRVILKDDNNWAWNENRLSLKLDKQISGESIFYSEVWFRNIGLPNVAKSSDLYNKDIVDPYNLEFREAYVQINGFLSKKTDLTIGRQQFAWGTADKLNPTNNLNPYDLEDILDFGRKRGSDAINLQYYFNYDFSLQAVFVPFFQPANMPVGVFSNVLNSSMDLPQGMVLKSFSDTLMMPKYNLGESSTAGLRFKGFAKGINFSLSYLWGYDGLPYSSKNILTPVDVTGGTSIHSQLSFIRSHIMGADLVTSIAGIGVWAEAAAFIPDADVVMTTDLSAFHSDSSVPVTQDLVLKKEPYVKFVIGGDYFFADGSYLNMQYLHGFIHERGADELNDYFFLRYEKNFFNDKLKVTPLGGGVVVNDWNDINNNYAIIYMPEFTYKASPNTEISLSCTIFDGKGQNLFTGLKDYDMLMFEMKYSF